METEALSASSASIRSSPGSTRRSSIWSAAAPRTCASRRGNTSSTKAAPADQLYLIRHGRVALEVGAPGRGALTIQTLGEGEIVGVSSLIPPYRWTSDARALDLVRAISMDATCLRNKCEADHNLGYEVMKRFVPVLVGAAADDAVADPRRLWRQD